MKLNVYYILLSERHRLFHHYMSQFGTKSGRVNNLCGRWLRLSSSRLLWVHLNQKGPVARKTVAQDEWSFMAETSPTTDFTVFARLMIIMYFYDY